MSAEDALEKAKEILSEKLVESLANSNWKQRLAGNYDLFKTELTLIRYAGIIGIDSEDGRPK